MMRRFSAKQATTCEDKRPATPSYQWSGISSFSPAQIMLKHPPLIRMRSNGKDERHPGLESVGRKSSIEQLSKVSTFGTMLENVRTLASSKGLWDDEMQRDLPKKWEKHGDMIVFPQNSFTHNNWRRNHSQFLNEASYLRNLWLLKHRKNLTNVYGLEMTVRAENVENYGVLWLNH
ncbi:hypothetical protein NECAME_08153 [Necator americanus]|uniref:Uncharacterized protein n=1 Tax=Necator americanus TaxID=51031 RepID=W2TJX6_NECAM|nr:hypothetical protein NECAME_08153 [Necator americanus]ETN82103.1 hypothetical protein NECAME_08153 [Necator americanus]